MLGETIKRLRESAGMSQGELADRLSVVRQTVSKWERGLSAPDAAIVVRMAEIFGVPVQEILGVQADTAAEGLQEELAQARALLEEKSRKERERKLADQKRGVILLLSFAALFAALVVRNPLAAACLVGLCFLAAAVVLYRNLPLLTAPAAGAGKLRLLRLTTLFNLAVLGGAVLTAALMGSGVLQLSREEEGFLAMLAVGILMILSGIISPRLPFNRHTGLRLPWTVQDEDAWNTAHQVIGCTAVPIALLYAAGVLAIGHIEAMTCAAMAAWIGPPAILSYLVYRRKRKALRKR